MGDGEQGNAHTLGRLIDAALHVDGHSTSALVQQCILWSMVEQASNGHALLLSA